MHAKQELRARMRRERADFVATVPAAVRGLILNRPPQEVADRLADCRTLGCYLAKGDEAPSLGWIRWFHENGWAIALPHLAAKDAAMDFRIWANPWDESELTPGYAGILQPGPTAVSARPDALIVPLVAFTAEGARLGQGAGHYDRWFAAHGPVPAIGLAWDVQKVAELPLEPHDQRLDLIVTPTSIYRGSTDAD